MPSCRAGGFGQSGRRAQRLAPAAACGIETRRWGAGGGAAGLCEGAQPGRIRVRSLAGPMPGSAPAGTITPSCRSPCRYPGHRPARADAAIPGARPATAARGRAVVHPATGCPRPTPPSSSPSRCRCSSRAGWLLRSDIQFHWDNRGYASFDDFWRAVIAQAQGPAQGARRRKMGSRSAR
jgi:hypothetical protein